MKNLRISLGVAAVVVASVGAMSFTTKDNVKVTSSDEEPVLIWLDEGGAEIGRQTKSEQDAECEYPKETICANGYEIHPVTGQPMGNPVAFTERPN